MLHETTLSQGGVTSPSTTLGQGTRTLSVQSSTQWLQTYYYLRAAVSVGWIALAVLVGKQIPPVGAALLVAYPAWDAFANYLDARKVGGLRANPTQTLNVVVSVVTAIAVGIALTKGMPAVITVFGVWAFFAGVSQLATGVRRWKTAGAQWVQILSGGQSALVSLFFFKNAASGMPLDVTAVAPYAGLGAFYFLLSAIWLTVKSARQHSTAVAT